jgi:hypothetical protein
MKPSLIYLVNPEDMLPPPSYAPNFTLPGVATDAANEDNKFNKLPTGAIVAGIAGAVPFIGFPAALIAAAVATSPLLASRMSREKPDLASKLEDAEKVEMERFMRNHAFTLEMACEQEFVFPPGHPLIGKTYKRHPLADIAGANKQNIYIPNEKYDTLLMEEREAELLKVLIYLGATRMTISRTTSRAMNAVLGGTLSGKAKVIEAEVGTKADESSSGASGDTREFVLTGRPWIDGTVLDRTKFAWLSFEPSWEALVIAREVGGCLSAALEIRENTSFSSDKALSLKVSSVLHGGKLSMESQRTLEEEKIYYVEAEFTSPLAEAVSAAA